MRWAAWTGAGACTSGPAPGGRALLAWLLEEYADDGMWSGGIYNCRSVRGASAPSIHGEGRAVDGMIPATPGKPTALGLGVLNRLGAVGAQLGVQCVIYARRIYSLSSPEGRHYGGLAPHWDHLHIELDPAAASMLTLARCRELLGNQRTPVATTAPVTPITPGDQGDDAMFIQRTMPGGKTVLIEGQGKVKHLSGDHAASLVAAGVRARTVNNREFDLNCQTFGSPIRWNSK